MAKTRSSTTTANTDNPETGDTTTPPQPACASNPLLCTMKPILNLTKDQIRAMHNRRCGGKDGCGREDWDPRIGVSNRAKSKPVEAE